MKGLNSEQRALVLGALDRTKTTHDKWYEFVDAMIQGLGGVGLDDELARQTKGKTMLDTSKKYKVGSVAYWKGMGGRWISGCKEITTDAMQQLYDDGLAVEVKEPFEKAFKVKFDSNGGGSGAILMCNLIRQTVGKDCCDTASVANRTFDVTIKERL